MTVWAGGPTVMLCMGRGWADSISLSIYFIQMFRCFNVRSEMLEIFYPTVVLSAVLLLLQHHCQKCQQDQQIDSQGWKHRRSEFGRHLSRWGSGGHWTNCSPSRTIPLTHSTPLHSALPSQKSSFPLRLIRTRCHKERFRKSFPPFAMKLYNNSSFCGSWTHLSAHKIPHYYITSSCDRPSDY